MPTCRRKRVVLTEPSEPLLRDLKSDPNREVFYLEKTGEIFETYEAYVARMSFYRLKHFQCEVTGKSGLDYFQAVESEQHEAKTMHSRFSEPLKPVILKAVQWQVVGRLDHLVEAVYQRFKDRYFHDERVIIDIAGIRYHAIVQDVHPPNNSVNHLKLESEISSTATPASSRSDDEGAFIHKIGGDLKIQPKDALAQDDPSHYSYGVRVMEPEKERGHDKGKTKAPVPTGELLTGTCTEVGCASMSRDRLAFSKSILRRFIRDCVDRAPAVASPWTVKPAIAKRYGVDSVMPEETRKGVENIKKGESFKRKKIWEDKEAPPSKKQRKGTVGHEERAAAEKREAEAHAKAEKQKAAKEEAERIANEKKKKKPVRYPTEDLDVKLSDKEKKAGMRVQRPVPNRDVLPFKDDQGTFEAFLMTWNFLIVYGQPLHLSTFTLDEFEHALRHSLIDPTCTLLAEIHSTLIYNLRTVPFQRHSAIRSMLYVETTRPVFGVPFPHLSNALSDVGNNWERVPLRSNEGREGWEDALVGCLKDHATLENFSRLREVLTQLLFAPTSTDDSPSVSSRASSPPNPPVLCEPSKPADRYYALPPADRIATLAFMCNVAVSSKAIHSHMEACEEQLTALRKEKIEVNRLKKQYAEEMNALLGEAKTDGEVAPETDGADEEGAVEDSSDLSDISEGSETLSSTSGVRDKKSRRQKERQNAQHAKQREIARAKVASAKQAQAEHRRLDEEVNKLERRLEGIEREFRKLLGGIRVKPVGKDRFYNRIWWFDGMGSASLLGSGGVVQYGAGRLFIQGPSQFDAELLQKRKDEVVPRRKEEEGEQGMQGSNDWGVYSDLEEIDDFMAWLNPKGIREAALKTALSKWWSHITLGIRKRIGDLTVNAKLPEARRSARTKTTSGPDITREPYMMWTNRRAVNSS